MARRMRAVAEGVHRAAWPKQGVKAETLKSRIQRRHRLEPDRPRPLPEQLPVQRQGRPGHGSRPEARGRQRGRLRLHAAPDPVRGAARIAAGGLRGAHARRPRPCARASRAATRAFALARGCAYVAVREPVVKSSADLPPPLRDMLDKTEIGHLTPPETTRAGRRDCSRCAARQRVRKRAGQEAKCATKCSTRRSTRCRKKFLKELREPGHDRVSIGLAPMSRPLALTLGEPAGIGPDITLAAWRAPRRARPAAVLPARPIRDVLARRAARLGLDVPIATVDAGDGAARLSRARCRWSPLGVAGDRRARPARRHQRAGRDRLDPPRGRRRARRARPPPSSPIRSPRTCSTAPASPIPATPNFSPSSPYEHDRQAGAAGDDAVVARARGRAGDDPPAAARRAAAAHHAT